MTSDHDPLSLVGKVMGKVEVLAKIGQGGMGVVYKGEHQILKKTVAIKVLPVNPLMPQEMRDRFLREARASASLEHSNIVQVVDIGKFEDMDYFIMQFVEGKTLQDLLDEKRILSVPDATNILMQTLDALEYAHSKQLVHRDIKPDNIMVTPEGKVKIMDFGLARQMHDQSITGTGHIVGTPQYMSPEQASGTTVDLRSDIYSLGITYYALLTGCVPFDGDTPISIITNKLKKKLRPPRHLNPTLPKNISNVVEKMASKAPSRRYQTCAEVRQAVEVTDVPYRLKLFASDISTEDYPTLSALPSNAHSRSTMIDDEYRLLYIFGGGIAVLLVIIVVILLFFSPFKSTPGSQDMNQLVRDLTTKGDMAFKRGDYKLAIKRYVVAYEESNQSPQIRTRLEKTYLRQGQLLFNIQQYKPAKQALEKLLQFNPYHQEGKVTLAKINKILNKTQPVKPPVKKLPPPKIILETKVPKLVRTRDLEISYSHKNCQTLLIILNGQTLVFDRKLSSLKLTGLKKGKYNLLMVGKNPDHTRPMQIKTIFEVDLTGPSLQVTSLPYTPKNIYQIKGQIAPPATGVDIKKFTIQGKQYPTPGGKFNASVPLTHNGPHQLSLVATDSNGNSTAKKFTVIRDNQPPKIASLTPAHGTISSKTKVALKLFSQDLLPLKAQVTVGDKLLPPQSRTAGKRELFFALDLAEGKNLITIRLTDAAGNSVVKKLVYYRVPKDMIYVKPGRYQVGEKVYNVTGGYFIGRYEVTFARYAKHLQQKNMAPLQDWKRNKIDPAKKANHPVVYVSYRQAQQFARDHRRKLPTLQQWIIAAYWDKQGGRSYPWGKLFHPRKANLTGFGKGNTVPVTTLKTGKSFLGCYHMVGNVAEWIRTPQGKPRIKGGSFDDKKIQADINIHPTHGPKEGNTGFYHIGFRCVMEIDLSLKK